MLFGIDPADPMTLTVVVVRAAHDGARRVRRAGASRDARGPGDGVEAVRRHALQSRSLGSNLPWPAAPRPRYHSRSSARMRPGHRFQPRSRTTATSAGAAKAARQVETALEAERFIEQVGFAACLTDSRRPGPSLYVAVCGRRDAVMPRNVQKDPEASLTWVLKDELIKRGKVYYAKLARGKAMFLAPRMIPYFHAVWGMRRAEEKRRLSRTAQAILRVLRREWEMSTSDLREESGVKDRRGVHPRRWTSCRRR